MKTYLLFHFLLFLIYVTTNLRKKYQNVTDELINNFLMDKERNSQMEGKGGMQMPQGKKQKLNQTENEKGIPCLNLVIFQIKQKSPINFGIVRDL